MVIRPQPTIKGYSAWILGRLVAAKATTPAEVTAWVIDRWIDDNREFLATEFGITREQFQRQAKVVDYRSKSR